ncbi:MAG: CsbD family protein [Leptospirillum sp.]|jgi:uncharacterized protein YjbJ (UPF0337 family)
MNWDIAEGSWDQFQEKVKDQWRELSEEDLLTISGNRFSLMDRLREVYGFSKDEAENQIREFEKIYKNEHQPKYD